MDVFNSSLGTHELTDRRASAPVPPTERAGSTPYAEPGTGAPTPAFAMDDGTSKDSAGFSSTPWVPTAERVPGSAPSTGIAPTSRQLGHTDGLSVPVARSWDELQQEQADIADLYHQGYYPPELYDTGDVHDAGWSL